MPPPAPQGYPPQSYPPQQAYPPPPPYYEGGGYGGYPAYDDRYQPEFPLKEDQRVPHGYHVEHRTRKGLVITGLVIGGIPYMLGLSSLPNANAENANAWLVVPVLGPWMTLQTRKACDHDTNNDLGTDTRDCLDDVGTGMLLIFDGLLQLTGGILVTIGVTATRPWAVKDGSTEVSIVPRVGPDGDVGFTARGAF